MGNYFILQAEVDPRTEMDPCAVTIRQAVRYKSNTHIYNDGWLVPTTTDLNYWIKHGPNFEARILHCKCNVWPNYQGNVFPILTAKTACHNFSNGFEKV